MKYFIPAWYNNGNWWEDKTAPYYSKRLVKEFDDMISLMNMYKKNDVNFELLVLNYYPDLRVFLHRHNLYEANYWSLFDEIQGFHHHTPHPIDYRELQWPEETEFIYTPYLIRCVTSTTTYSNIYFNQYGYMIWIESFKDKVRQHRYIFDDRGFLSSVLNFDKSGQPYSQQYMTIDGDSIFTLDLKKGSVKVSKKYYHRFNQQKYDSMELLLQEQMKKYVTAMIDEQDDVIIAADERHNMFLSHILEDTPLCFSIFKNRNCPLTPSKLASIERGKYWLVDMLENEASLKMYKDKQQLDTHIMRITPFDAQVLPNKSSQFYETFIGFWIDGLDEATLQNAFSRICKYVEQNENMRLVLLTEVEEPKIPSWLKDEITSVNDRYNERSEDANGIQVLQDDEVERVEIIKLKHVPFESELIEAISTLRVVIDLNKEPDLFLQISSMSAGIPQINMRETDYVKDKINGIVIDNLNEVVAALDYYISHLKNWNYSFAYSIKLVETYASMNIIQRLSRWFEGERNEAKI